MRRRVVVTGIGAITPVGQDVESMWKVLCESGSGIGRISHFDASNFPTKIAAEVHDFDLSRYTETAERFQHSGRNVHFAIGAGVQAVHDSGILDFNQDPVQGIAEALAAPERLDDQLLDRLLTKCSEHLSIFAAPVVLDRD